MGPDMDFAKEMMMELSKTGGGESSSKGGKAGPTIAVPPEPPAKELPRPPVVLRTMPPAVIASPSQPPNRPLPPRPTTRPGQKSTDSPRLPPPTRRPPLRPQGPLSMNPPTRPGTAATQSSATSTVLRFPGSTKRLSWTSIASRRPTKFAQGKYGRVELVPQPTDDPEDPLVCLGSGRLVI